MVRPPAFRKGDSMTQKPAFKPEYRKPTGTWIGRSEATERLYDLESKRDKAFKAATKELQEVMQWDHFWYEAVPEALLSMLEGWDHNAAQLGARTYLEKQNDREYTDENQRYLILKCNLDRFIVAIDCLDRMIGSNQFDALNDGQREAVVWLTNLFKVHNKV